MYSHASSSSSRRPSVRSSPNPFPPSTSIFFGAVIFLSYLSFVVWIYVSNSDGYYVPDETCPFAYVNAYYFSVVTLSTIGYGDIVPATHLYKFLSSVFVLVGFGIIEIVLSRSVDTLLDVLESSILFHIRAKMGPNTRIKAKYFDYQNNRMTNYFKGIIAFGVLFLCIVLGMLVLLCVEKLGFIDSLYLLLISITTVGYGDKSFSTCFGRAFASVWLIFLTFTVAYIILLLAKVRINQRQQRIRKVTLSRSEFMIYKLKDKREASVAEIMQICKQFSVLDPNNTGKVTLPI